MESCSALFPQAAIYFTDEIQDGRPFDGLVEGKLENLWSFDLAIIPESLTHLYANPLKDYVMSYSNSQLYSRNSTLIPFDPW